MVTICAVAGAIGAFAAPAAASAAEVQQADSQNWAGYVVSGGSGTSGFSAVSGSWVQPRATCTSGSGHAAFWVGLGGSGQSQSLEQTGTETDCAADGSASYFAWYELVPSAPVRLALTVSPGDRISARVAVSGTQVRITLSDQTSGQSADRTVSMSNPDTSSAEWIAEAPSECAQSVSQCQTLPLSDFGRVDFSNASATSSGGHAGPISDPSWSASAVTLQPGDGGGYGPQYTAQETSSAGASPSSLSGNGSAFDVAWSAQAQPTAAEGTGYGYGYGGGGYGGDGSGGGYLVLPGGGYLVLPY